MKDLEQALALIREHQGDAAFVGPRSELVVRSAEKALGLKLPPTYRRFLREQGAGSFGAAEIYGVVDIDFERSSVPDAVWVTLGAREHDDLPADLVVVAQEDDEIACLRVLPRRDDAEAAEGPVIVLNTGEDPDRVGARTAAEDFGAYLLSRVEEELEAPR
jgi:hypothetical protein